MDEQALAKAIEAAGLALGVAKPIVETGCKFAESLLGEPLKAAGGMLADRIYAWQTVNRIKIAARTKRLCDVGGVKPRKVASGFLLPFFDKAGNVDDPDLAELWAQLLTSAVRDDAAQHPLFIRTLEGMSRDDALVVRKVARAPFERVAIDRMATEQCIRVLVNGGSEDDQREQRAVIRLDSLGIINAAWSGNDLAKVSFTAFGAHFAAAVGLIEQPISLLTALYTRALEKCWQAFRLIASIRCHRSRIRLAIRRR